MEEKERGGKWEVEEKGEGSKRWKSFRWKMNVEEKESEGPSGEEEAPLTWNREERKKVKEKGKIEV